MCSTEGKGYISNRRQFTNYIFWQGIVDNNSSSGGTWWILLQTKCPASCLANEDNFNWIAMSMSSVPTEDPTEPEISCSNRFRILFRKATTYMKMKSVQCSTEDCQHWGSACCLLWTRSGNSSERERLLCCLLWWRLRWAEPSQVLVNIIVIFAEG